MTLRVQHDIEYVKEFAMNTKLTLSLDKDVIDRAKRYARRRHQSLSKMVENYLREVATPEGKEEDITPLVAELSGLLNPEQADRRRKEYADYLEEKYR
jgi:macrodomain Ter protein organizer (MatP/YcbG family)